MGREPAFRCVGIDLSLTGTGVVNVGVFDAPGVWTAREVLVKTGSSPRTPASRWTSPWVPATNVTRLVVPHWVRTERLQRACDAIVDATTDAELAVIEAPSYGSNGGSAHERAGLYWMVCSALRAWQIPFATVAPKARAKYATGDGAAKKASVVAATLALYKPTSRDDNIADAYVLAAMGCRAAGYPMERNLPEDHVEATRSVLWPDERRGWR